ncbi:endoplasmin [Tanacetum coccineum]
MSICVRGVGYEKEDLIKNLGITMFGTLAFVEKMQICGDLNLIVQFGVGFYLVHLIAEYVEVINKYNDDKQYGMCGSRRLMVFLLSLKIHSTNYLAVELELDCNLREEAGEYLDESKLKVHADEDDSSDEEEKLEATEGEEKEEEDSNKGGR